MKSLRESLFDKDLVEKNINFFNLYSWYYGDVSIILPSGAEVPLQVASENEFRFDQLFKKDKLNKLPHPEELIKISNDNYVLRNVYNALLTSSMNEFRERSGLTKIVSNAVSELLKVKTTDGSRKCIIYPTSAKHKNLLDDNIKSILIAVESDFKINQNSDRVYRIRTVISLKRKH